MTNEKKEITLLERFESHASSKAFAKKIYNRVCDVDFMHMDLCAICKLPGIGRAAILLIAEVAADLSGKK